MVAVPKLTLLVAPIRSLPIEKYYAYGYFNTGFLFTRMDYNRVALYQI